ncbi:MAG: phosphopentomutase [Lactobacillaceae bacterium]|jgi:phosphopentomutase|nr:phosphopentomutase [Lactobacillaceae bacterium]
MGRVIILMMDSFGIGGAHDAEEFGDLGTNTFGHIANLNDGLNIPNLQKLGLPQAAKGACGLYPVLGIQDAPPKITLPSKYGHMSELSIAKDTSSGHWEMAGVPVLEPWGYFKPDYPSFPKELVQSICAQAGIEGILGDKAASGTEIIQELGEKHIKTGKPIFYTSADSNMQIAAHEEHFGLDKLYKLCEIAFKEVKPYNIARIIARPFIGEKAGEFTRTKNRHDYSVTPPAKTVLDKLKDAGGNVIAIGKIADIYANQGITKAVKASGLEELWNKTLEEIKSAPDKSVIFTNFVDFDMLWGHRRDVEGYAKGLEYFDKRLPEIEPVLKHDDIVFITADHGCDPSYKGSDHTREQVPVIMFGRDVKPENIGHRETFADIAQTIAEYFNLEPFKAGKSFL